MPSVMMSRVEAKVGARRLTTRPARAALNVKAFSRTPNAVTGGAVVLGGLMQASPALADATNADVTVDVDGTIEQLIQAVKVAGAAIKTGAEFVGSGVETVKEGYETAEPYLQQGYSTVVPLVQQGYSTVAPLVQQAIQPVISAAAPIIKDNVDSVVDVVNRTGVRVGDVVGPISSAAQFAVTTVGPLVLNVGRFVTSTSPTLLGEYALGAVALYLLTPPLLGAVAGSLRGYAGEVSAGAAADMLLNGNATLVDLRSQREKEASGVPDLPSNARDRVLDVEYGLTEDRRLRGSLRDPAAVERQVTALQVAALRRVSKGSVLLLLDRYGSNSTAVAKELAAMGYSKVFVVSGGFDGRLGWVQSKLQIKPAASDISGIVAPTPRIGTRKQLMAPR